MPYGSVEILAGISSRCLYWQVVKIETASQVVLGWQSLASGWRVRSRQVVTEGVNGEWLIRFGGSADVRLKGNQWRWCLGAPTALMRYGLVGFAGEESAPQYDAARGFRT